MKLTNRTYRNLVAILTLSIVFTNSGLAQETNDLQGWSSIGVDYKAKKWDFDLEQHLRLDENISEISEYFTQFETAYEVFEDFKLGLGLRYIRENDNEGNVQGYENHFRYHVEAKYKHKIARLSLRYRLRYQNKNELGEDDFAKQNIRLKAGLEYNIKNWKLDPQFAAEVSNRFGQDEASHFSKYRLTLGTEYDFKKWGKLGAYFRIENDINETEPERISILGLKYKYSIK